MKIDKSVEMYELTPEDINLFKGKSGVYAFIYDNEVIYVGQSKNIKNRIQAHNRETAFDSTLKKIIQEEGSCNRCKALAMYDFFRKHREEINFIVLKETEELDRYEEHYIKLFLPKYNYKGVNVPYKTTKEE